MNTLDMKTCQRRSSGDRNALGAQQTEVIIIAETGFKVSARKRILVVYPFVFEKKTGIAGRARVFFILFLGLRCTVVIFFKED